MISKKQEEAKLERRSDANKEREIENLISSMEVRKIRNEKADWSKSKVGIDYKLVEFYKREAKEKERQARWEEWTVRTSTRLEEASAEDDTGLQSSMNSKASAVNRASNCSGFSEREMKTMKKLLALS